MADDRFPNDPNRPLGDDEYGRAARQDSRLQPDPELGEGPASSAKIALFAVAIAVVLGAVFYGLNNTSVNQASTQPPSTTAQTQPVNPAAPPGTNTQPGTTTGSATNQPQNAPSQPGAAK